MSIAYLGHFPFGEPVAPVMQADCTPKKVFVLGVYASAVHARWIDVAGHLVVRALAVRSEPEIFWRGEHADELIAQIQIPAELGRLEPADEIFNGPSGRALDSLVLSPLGLDRSHTWLCDLVPHSCANRAQLDAVATKYDMHVSKWGLTSHSVPTVPKQLADNARRDAILGELQQSQANVLILLGDQPIRWFLSHHDSRWKRLADFGTTLETYGQLHGVKIGGNSVSVLPIAHPRQIAGLGSHSAKWRDAHDYWVQSVASGLGVAP